MHRMVECGGLLHERRKWSSLYTQGTWSYVVYCVALDAWCWPMIEDGRTNRMIDSINAFATCKYATIFCERPIMR
jgi:hypothetical protein